MALLGMDTHMALPTMRCHQMTNQIGQIGLRRNGTTRISKAIEWCTDSTSHHNVIILPDGMCISGEPGGARYRPLTDYPQLDVSAYPLTDEQRALIVKAAHASIGTPYNYMVFPILALRRLTHLPIPQWVKTWLNNRPHEDCASLTNLIHNEAGIHLMPNGKLTTPGDYERDMRARGYI